MLQFCLLLHRSATKNKLSNYKTELRLRRIKTKRKKKKKAPSHSITGCTVHSSYVFIKKYLFNLTFNFSFALPLVFIFVHLFGAGIWFNLMRY